MRPLSKGNSKQSGVTKSIDKIRSIKQKPTLLKPSSTIPSNVPKPKNVAQKHQSKIIKPSNPIKRIIQKNSPITNIAISNLPMYLFYQIIKYSATTIVDILKLSHVCQNWRALIYSQDGPILWQHINQKITNIKQMKILWKDRWIQLISKNFQNHEKQFCRLFEYGSTKQNIPNKLIKKLGLQINLRLNKMDLKNIPFTVKTFNFSSYLMSKVLQINKLQFDFSTPHNLFKDKLQFQFTFYSRTFMFQHSIKKTYLPEDIYKHAIRQKAFNYYLDKNFIFTFFQGDKSFLYLFIQFSVLQIINEFRNKMKKNKQKLVIPSKSIKIWKQLSQTQFDNFIHYFKYQADFQLHFSFHNSLKQIFTHCDTKVFPVDYNNKSALFAFKIKDSFPKQATYKLDNKMGMSQNVPNLFLLDLILKDRDRFLITFSGFIYVKILTQQQKSRLDDFMSMNGKDVISLCYKQNNYSFEIILIDEGDRYYIPSMSLQLNASIIFE